MISAGKAVGEGSGDEQILKDARIAVDGTGLLDYLRQRTAEGGEAERIKTLIRQLGDDSFQTREEASNQLVAIGARARTALREAANDTDVEIVRRAEDCLRRIDQGATATVLAAAVRMTALRKPEGAVTVLLNYLPSAEDETIAEEVRVALTALAVREGKVEPALMTALADRTPVRRTAAAVALIRARLPEPLPALRKFLQDPDKGVRWRVALALAETGHKEAVPALIGLLEQAPSRETGLIENLLGQLAGDHAPVGPGSDENASRRKLVEAWQTWWKDHGDRVESARLEEIARELGFTLVVLLDAGQVLDLDASNRQRWKVEGLQFPLDAQLLPGNRVLVAEHNGNRVTERNQKGDVVWEKAIESPLAAQRLPNGNTFIATPAQLIEVDGKGKEVFNYIRPGGESIMKAQKLANGDIAMITKLGVTRYVRIDKAGKELGSFGVNLATSGGKIDVTPKGHVLVPEMNNNRVVEHDPDGKIVWEAMVSDPVAAVRLPNGHTLVTSMTLHQAIELDRKGKEVWHYKTTTRVTRAFRH
jgi:hypothetical protein